MTKFSRPKMLILLLLCFLLSCSGSKILVYRHPGFDINKSYRIAVLPFKDAVGHPGSGEIVAEIFETTLLSSSKFEMIERIQLNKILEEQELSLTGLIEKPLAVGKIVKADLVVVGSVTTWHQAKWGGSPPTTVGASIKAVNVETGLTFWSIDKSVSATFWTDGLPTHSPRDIVAKKLCRKMVEEFVGM